MQAIELIKNTYKNAIEYRTIPSQLRGVMLLFGVLTSGLVLKGGWDFYSEIIDRDGQVGTFFYVLFSIIALMGLCGLLLLLLTIRLELFRPIDEPVLFDRLNRKVYLIARAVEPGWRGLFKPWPVRAYEYDWNLIDAEYQLTISTTGSTVTTWHTLLFIVRCSASDHRTIGSFNVANPVLLSESTVGAFWEHIRRFMEEDGPHLPPGETKTYLEVPASLWQSMGTVGPFGPNYVHWWKNHPFYNFVIHLFIPFTLPVFVAWGIMNWLSYLTATDVQWPHEVEAAVGPACQ
ncbi:MAG: DUF6708 domain-containing protein [Telluria sp.]